MSYDFDRELNRIGRHSVKWEFVREPTSYRHWDRTRPELGAERVLPMWVADMDFPAPAAVVAALVERAQHGIYGYALPTDTYYRAVVEWMQRRHNWAIDADWICLTPGVVPALNLLVRTFVAPGEKVLIQPPVYHPFFKLIQANDAQAAFNPLRFVDGRYSMDFEDLERQVRDPKVTMAILCSPHNPVGRVWDREELQRFGKLCHSNDVLVVADEIHADLILSTHNFTPFATLGDADPARTIVCTAASKTFNLAGLHQSNIIIPDPELRARYNAASLTSGMPGPSSFGILALETAYNQGEAWLESVMGYIEANWRFLERTLAERIPQVSAATLEGTYLAWLDFRALDLPPDALRAWMLEEVRVYLDDGEKFGPGGIGFQRMNIACPRAILADALDRLARAAPRAARIAHDR